MMKSANEPRHDQESGECQIQSKKKGYIMKRITVRKSTVALLSRAYRDTKNERLKTIIEKAIRKVDGLSPQEQLKDTIRHADLTEEELRMIQGKISEVTDRKG